MNNSDIDFPLLSSQFKDLNLQLHASTNVTNPYTFSIQGNRSFSASVEEESSRKYKLTVEVYGDYHDVGNEEDNYTTYSYGFVLHRGVLSPTSFKGVTIDSLFTEHDDNSSAEYTYLIFSGHVTAFNSFKIMMPWKTYTTTHYNYNSYNNTTQYYAVVTNGDFYDSYVGNTYDVSIEEI